MNWDAKRTARPKANENPARVKSRAKILVDLRRKPRTRRARYTAPDKAQRKEENFRIFKRKNRALAVKP